MRIERAVRANSPRASANPAPRPIVDVGLRVCWMEVFAATIGVLLLTGDRPRIDRVHRLRIGRFGRPIRYSVKVPMYQLHWNRVGKQNCVGDQAQSDVEDERVRNKPVWLVPDSLHPTDGPAVDPRHGVHDMCVEWSSRGSFELRHDRHATREKDGQRHDQPNPRES